MNADQIKRAEHALIETRKLLIKELSYREDLQNKEMVEFYQNHIAKLELAIAYFTNPDFRAFLEQKVWEINEAA